MATHDVRRDRRVEVSLLVQGRLANVTSARVGQELTPMLSASTLSPYVVALCEELAAGVLSKLCRCISALKDHSTGGAHLLTRCCWRR